MDRALRNEPTWTVGRPGTGLFVEKLQSSCSVVSWSVSSSQAGKDGARCSSFTRQSSPWESSGSVWPWLWQRECVSVL